VLPRRHVQTIESLLSGVADLEGPGHEEFLQAIREVASHVWPTLHARPEWRDARIFERLVEPDRILTFRVDWEDDDGRPRSTRAWRVQHSNLLGPYKGGLRFTPDLRLPTLRFLAFEQVLKGSLTGTPLGGAKGGAAFDRRAASTSETRRFCRALMCALHPHVGLDRDVPAGDIGVGARELGWMHGMHLELGGDGGALTGKPVSLGGLPVRAEATGFGLVYFVREALGDLEGRRVGISGAGNVALHAAAKAIELGARVLTLSDSSGTRVFATPLDVDVLATVRDHKLGGGSLSELPPSLGEQRSGTPWSEPMDVALPCATQNELDGEDARALAKNDVDLVAEGANMPCTAEAIDVLDEAQIPLAPGKAANAGGVVASQLEMVQHATQTPMSRRDADAQLQSTMKAIHDRCVAHGESYARGADVAAFLRWGEARIAS